MEETELDSRRDVELRIPGNAQTATLFHAVLNNVCTPSSPEVRSSRWEYRCHSYSLASVPGTAHMFSVQTTVLTTYLQTSCLGNVQTAAVQKCLFSPYKRVPMNVRTKAAARSGIGMPWWGMGPSPLNEQGLYPSSSLYTWAEKYQQKSVFKPTTSPIHELQCLLLMPTSLPEREKERKKRTDIVFRSSYSQQGWPTVRSSKGVFVDHRQVFILVQITRGRKGDNRWGEVK